jgi:hypothetical protein
MKDESRQPDLIHPSSFILHPSEEGPLAPVRVCFSGNPLFPRSVPTPSLLSPSTTPSGALSSLYSISPRPGQQTDLTTLIFLFTQGFGWKSGAAIATALQHVKPDSRRLNERFVTISLHREAGMGRYNSSVQSG